MSFRVKGAPFRYRGVIDVSDCKTSKEVMQVANLDWGVAKCELVAKMPDITDLAQATEGFSRNGNFFRDCPNAYGVYRTDNNVPLGIVKGRYTPVQNVEAFNFFDEAIGKNSAIWQTAGCFGNGERIFVSAKLPNNILVNGEDPVENYLVFTTSHDGSSGVKILFTPIRVICQNTLNAAIKQSNNYVSFRHTASVHTNINAANEILGISKIITGSLQEEYNHMAKLAMDDNKAQEIFSSIIFTDKEIENIAFHGRTVQDLITRNWSAIQEVGVSMKKVNALCEMNNYYHVGPGQRETLGTAWGVYGAVTGFYSNVDNAEGVKRMDSLLYGDKSNKIKKAGDLILL